MPFAVRRVLATPLATMAATTAFFVQFVKDRRGLNILLHRFDLEHVQDDIAVIFCSYLNPVFFAFAFQFITTQAF
jgi:hypothetical protein